MTIKKILILRGIQGSGKSTFAKKWIEEDPDNRIRFNRDDIRNMMGKYWLPKREGIINNVYWEFLNSAMLDGYDIVVDNMNLNPSCISEIKELVKSFNEWIALSEVKIQYKIEIKDFFDTPLEECIRRDSLRPNPIGEKVIRNTYDKYKSIINADI